jgi:glucose/arabinose dehydrogenase
MTNEGHVSRTLLLSSRYPDYLLVSRGSAGNDDIAAIDRSSGHSQIRAFNISAIRKNQDDEGEKKTAQDFGEGKLLGWGLRNSVGVAEHPSTGGIWSVENSVDNLRRHGEDIHENNPGEELNFHGYLNGSTDHQGGNYGYPVCYTIWSTKNFPDLGDLETGDQFPADQEEDSDLVTIQDDDQCNTEYVPPELAFQAHTAPLDIKFDANGTRAFVSFHGSCKSHPPPPAPFTISISDIF